MGPAYFTNNDGDSVYNKLMLDGQHTSLKRTVAMRAEPHIRPSRFAAKIPGEMLEVDIHHIHAERIPQDWGLLVPLVSVGSIFRLGLLGRI